MVHFCDVPYDEDPLEMTKLLVEAGAPIDAESHQGASIRDFAQRNGHQIEVLWVIEEDDQELIDVGLDFKNLYNLDFQITSK